VKLLSGLLGAAALFAQTDSDMSRIAQSPYEIERWVNQTPTLDWKSLWNALHIEGSAFLPPCYVRRGELRECGAEAITVGDPSMVILVLRSDYDFEEYLRFLPATKNGATTGWKLAGHFAPFVKYFPPSHILRRVGDKPFLLVRGQDQAGTCVSSEVEHWIDLTGNDMKPVFEYTVKGHRCGSSIPNREVNGFVKSVETEPTKRIKVFYEIEFSEPHLATLHSETVSYVWSAGHGYEVDDEHSTLSGKLVATMFEDLGDPTPEEFLQFDLNDLKEIAKGSDRRAKRWLVSFLRRCKATQEKQLIEELLYPPAKK